ncbi:MAG: hypothetical protein QXY09_05465 [Acidilobaceae archaeon]
MNLQITGESRKELLTKLLLYSLIYGLIHVNYIDLVVPGSNAPGYHLWLIILYFAPFIPVLFILGFDDWELLVSMGLIASLMNDLFYFPIGNLLLKWFPNSSIKPGVRTCLSLRAVKERGSGEAGARVRWREVPRR